MEKKNRTGAIRIDIRRMNGGFEGKCRIDDGRIVIRGGCVFTKKMVMEEV